MGSATMSRRTDVPLARAPALLLVGLAACSAPGPQPARGAAPAPAPAIEFLRTPDERFAGLPDYPFEPRYAEVDGLRVHFVDEGPRAAPVVLLLHGEPSWSFLYRHMIPPLVEAGYRVVAPDLVGFGKSDKPVRREDYSYARHVEWMRALLFDRLRLEGITLFAQDWGGLIGLRLVAEHPQRFARVAVANTTLPLPQSEPPAVPPESCQAPDCATASFLQWVQFSQTVPEFPVGSIVQGATVRALTPAEVRAYEAPFPDERYKAGARVFPVLVPVRPDDPAVPANRAAWEVLARWDRPFLTLFSDQDPITAGMDAVFQSRVPGARGQPHRTIENGGHFLQEDQPAALTAALLAFLGARAAPDESAAQDMAPRCTDAVHRQFDFWIGSWTVRNPDGAIIGTNEITRAARGCALLENWRGAGGGAGISVNTYDAARGAWTQRWVGDGSTLWLEGRLQGNAMVLAGTAPRDTPRGAVLDRITWTPLPDGRVSQVWELSMDGGATWTPSFHGIYERSDAGGG